MPVRLIVFDYAGVVVVSPELAFGEFSLAFDKSHGINHLAHNRAWRSVESSARVGRVSYAEAQKRVFKRLGKSEEVCRSWIRADREIHLHKTRLSEPMARTLGVLKRKGMHLAILSDSSHSASLKRRVLERLGASTYFDDIFSSCEIGCVKPTEKAYALACRRFKVKPYETVFIGHAKDELNGASTYGMNVIAYRPDDKVYGYPVAKKFSDIPKLIESLSR